MYHLNILLILTIFLFSSITPSFSELTDVMQFNYTISEQRIHQLETDIASLKSENNELCNPFTWKTDCDWPTTAQIIVSIIAGLVPSIVIPFVIYYYDKKSDRRSRPLLLDSANNVFNLISGTTNKEIWTLLPELYNKYIIENDLGIFHNSSSEKQIYQFKENLNKLGALYLADVIDEKFLFNTYGGKIIEFYCMLKDDIEDVRNHDYKEEHCLLFECMHYASANYMRDHNDPRYDRLQKKFKEKFPLTIPQYIYDKIPKEYYKRL